jgi:H/ACA ribonucleoprotein complex subunit 4
MNMMPISPKMLIKAEAETSPYYGKNPGKREVTELLENGIIIIDKPSGPSSHQVTAWVKGVLGVAKAGHGGTLDPLVTGVLPIALQTATKAIGILHSATKEYVCVMRLHSVVDESKIRAVCGQMVGPIMQTPPKEAAVKKVERKREIFYLNILEIKGTDVLFVVGCEGGTYIRVLCEDIGKKLGCGAHMAELRRTKSAFFQESDACTLHNLLDAFIFWKQNGSLEITNIIRPTEDLLDCIPHIVIRDSAVDAACHGADIALPGVLQVEMGIKADTLIAVKTLKGEGVALGTTLLSTREMMEKDTGIAVNVTRVLMKKGTYPSMWRKR